jgi:hypothetical protein
MVGPTNYRAPADVRYQVSGDNSILKLVLYRLWNKRCYWCMTPVVFRDAQIDHAIPRSVTSEALPGLLADFGLAAGFDLHGPENLAPICPSCNNWKRDRVLRSGLMEVRLQLIAGHAPTVIKKALAFDATTEIAQFTAALSAGVQQPVMRAALLEQAPQIVQSLADLDESAVDFVITRSAELQFGDDHPARAVLTLDSRGRSIDMVVTELCGSSWSDLLNEGLADVVAETAEEGRSLAAGMFDDAGQMASFVTDWLEIAATPTTLTRHESAVVIGYTGMVHGSYAGDGIANNIWGDGDPAVVDYTAEAYVSARFHLSVRWDLRHTQAGPAFIAEVMDRSSQVDGSST